MTLKDYRSSYETFSSIASELVRKLAFAGIAIIWIFRIGDGQQARFDDSLLWPLAFMAFALAADLAQYVSATLMWGYFGRKKEKELLKKNHQSTRSLIFIPGQQPTQNLKDSVLESILKETIVAPRWMNWPTITFFWLKITLVSTGQVLLLKYLLSVLL